LFSCLAVFLEILEGIMLIVSANPTGNELLEERISEQSKRQVNEVRRDVRLVPHFWGMITPAIQSMAMRRQWLAKTSYHGWRMSGRKIVHVDMDAFYASVEQRDTPELRGRPVVVAWRGKRSVVCAASYEARRYGVRSAMAATYAERLCPQAVFVPPDFPRYRAVSCAVREIFLRHTDLIEPLSLDEAYLDVTENKTGLATATKVAIAIRQQIREEIGLTASAGVAPNKFLAKIASDWRKPNGLFVIQPAEVESFLTPLPVGRIPGVGKVTEARLAKIGLRAVGELRAHTLGELQRLFGRYGERLYELARGIDESPVVPNRPTKSISAEDTFEEDVLLGEIEPMIRRLAEKAWIASRKEARIAHTVVLKLKTADFRVLTRSQTPPSPPASSEELTRIALFLRDRVDVDPRQRFRLVGVGLGNFRDPGEGGEPSLFP
jgi:DNA polymerase-4